MTDAVRAGMSLCKAQKEFGVPKQTLSHRIWKMEKYKAWYNYGII